MTVLFHYEDRRMDVGLGEFRSKDMRGRYTQEEVQTFCNGGTYGIGFEILVVNECPSSHAPKWKEPPTAEPQN
jgi:hypothetical protein